MSATIKPGVGNNDDEVTETAPVGQLAPVDSLLDLIRNLIPANIVYASFAQISTGRTAMVTTYDCTLVPDFSLYNKTKTEYKINEAGSGYDQPVTCPYSNEWFLKFPV